ncbi:alanine racemase [Microvirga tunisiensis]|uniref:Alanine racemase n=2 Tax=Pannonibacter tanglangensis TaxID=2750084 RepID=A0ABW9ZJ65_9HYPH|nr:MULTISPECIES: alanine racemase [unclassified Pannonibacter]NBN64078.1 alanine racemase [Pannonibacter sp. XCT-34]NBN77719.1 alanine racemase [Pannonibacter sp. XCT-53]
MTDPQTVPPPPAARRARVTVDDAGHGSVLTIDPAAIARNWQAITGVVGPATAVAATIKSDAYGCGIGPVVRALSAAGCSTFFVALPQEGLAARREAPSAVIYVLNGLLPGAAPLYAEARLRPVLGSLPEVEDWALFCRSRKVPLEAALHLDTGMNRLGLPEEDAARIAADSVLTRAFRISLVMSHLACGSSPVSPFNRTQLARFEALSARFPGLPRSLANSAGVYLGPDFHFDLVRPGIALYGGEIHEGDPLRLAPVLRLEAHILQLRTVAAGTPVGYGQAQVTTRPTRLAILSTGYGDGYHRRAGGSDDRPGATAWLAGHRVPLFGRISMDLMAVDVTDVPADLARRGARVELLGPNADITAVAAAAETIDYELLTGLGRRHRRVYGPLGEDL